MFAVDGVGVNSDYISNKKNENQIKTSPDSNAHDV